jgi:2-polyprenyl-3-methyl-5-hydroxy-6-metoxy-1,4-benzoquinol methylase
LASPTLDQHTNGTPSESADVASVAGEAFRKSDRCPCCGSSVDNAKLAVSSSPPAERLSVEKLGKFLSGYASERVFFSYFRCEDCGAYYCPTYLNDNQLAQLYSQQQENMAEAPLLARQKTQAGYYEIFRQLDKVKGDYLELGADIGLFSELIKQDGSLNRFWLYEPNLSVHNELTKRMSGADIQIFDRTFEKDDVAEQSLAAAVMIHVLDHVPDPATLLADMHSRMLPGGVVLVVVHDTGSLLAKILGRRWPPFTLQHPHLFASHPLSKLLTTAGFEVLDVPKTRNFFPLPYLINAAFSIFGLGRLGRLRGVSPLLGLKLGNIAVTARKNEIDMSSRR